MAFNRQAPLLIVALIASLVAADDGADPDAATPPSAADVEQQMLEELEPANTIEPTERPADSSAASTSVEVDPKVIGTTPPNVAGTAPAGVGRPRSSPALHRDGEFIISRRGRLVADPGGTHALFVFDADSEKAPETPMIMLPCQMLQDMENVVAERGDSLVFIISGQVYTYRGGNYLLPTMWKPAADRGNLQP